MVANSNGLLWKTNHLLALSVKRCKWMVWSFNSVWPFTINENYQNLIIHRFTFVWLMLVAWHLQGKTKFITTRSTKMTWEFLKFCAERTAQEWMKSGSGQVSSQGWWKFWANEMSLHIKQAGQMRPKLCTQWVHLAWVHYQSVPSFDKLGQYLWWQKETRTTSATF